MMKFLRENWDIGFIVTTIGLILGWALFLCLVSPLLGQTDPRAIVQWQPIQDSRLVGYKVLRGTTPTAVADVATVPETTWQDDSIEPTIKYYYAVRGYDAVQNGLVSSAVQFRFSDIQPASPSNVTVVKVGTSQGKVSVRVGWAVVLKTRSLILIPAGAQVTYNVFLSNTGSIQKFAVLQGTSLTVGNLRKHKTIYFYVTAVWNGIESLGSPAVRVQT